MPSYQPFLIADFKTALELNKEPWLLPRDAFTELTNAYIEYGVVKKRKGYTEFSDTSAGVPIVGVMNYVASDGSSSLLAATVDRTYKYNPTTGVLDDLDLADVWTGDNDNLISYENFRTVMYMVNGKDQMRQFDGSSTSAVTVDIDGLGGNDLDFAVHVAVNKERLILFNTSESGVRYPQRARWSKTTDATDFSNDEFVDAPTSGWIVSYAYIGDDIVVWFENSVWVLRYTADSTLPFRWEKLTSQDGSAAPYSAVSFKDQAISLGKGGHVWTDSVQVERIDQKIPDIVLTMNQDKLQNSSGILNEELRHIITFYPTATATSNDNALALNFEEWSWSKYENMPFNVAGFFEKDQTETWATIGGTWSEQTETWVSNAIQAGYPIIVAGKNDGKLYKINDSGADDGAAITVEIMSSRWNPFASNGMKARFGWVDILVSSIAGGSLTLDFFVDFNQTSYATVTVALDGDGDKEWIRVHSGAVGESHRIKITETSSGQPLQIHALMPYMKPAGRIS